MTEVKNLKWIKSLLILAVIVTVLVLCYYHEPAWPKTGPLPLEDVVIYDKFD